MEKASIIRGTSDWLNDFTQMNSYDSRVKFLVVCLSRAEGVNSFLSFQSQPQNGDNDFNR